MKRDENFADFYIFYWGGWKKTRFSFSTISLYKFFEKRDGLVDQRLIFENTIFSARCCCWWPVLLLLMLLLLLSKSHVSRNEFAFRINFWCLLEFSYFREEKL